ncbi:MAG: nicotinate-nucleotide--dimethylbenzimidazole phosphoribosyltransferase, partial [Acidimicrobiales bacterium]
ALAAALAAATREPVAPQFWFAGHRSVEPGASVALAHLGLDPLLDLGMRLGEGSGACLALPVLQAAAKVLGEMSTLDGAGVSKKE